jgi:hypothetical protein
LRLVPRGVLALVGVLCAATPAAAYPFLSLRPGFTPFEGPTDPELSSIWWNPAALVQVRGFHVALHGQLALERGAIDRSSICLTSGVPDAGCDPSNVRAFSSVPIDEAQVNGFGAIAWDFRTENLTIAFGAFAPWQAHRSFPDGGNGSIGTPTAYHLRGEDFTTIYYALALAVHVFSQLDVGASLALADSSARLAFDRDTALDGGSATVARAGYENPAFAQHLALRGDGGSFWSTSVLPSGIPAPAGLEFALGALYHPSARVAIGFAWRRMFPLFRSGYGSSDALGATVTGPAPCDARTCRGGVSIDYDIPDVYHLGARIRLRDDLELSTWARLVVYGGYEGGTRDLTVRLSGDPVDLGAVPSQIVLARALVPAFAGEVGLRWRPRPALRLGASFIAETSAVPADHLNAEAIDGPKLDGMLAAEYRFRFLRFTVGYELTGLFLLALNSPQPGAFDPRARVRCVDSANSLDACGDSLAGRALPTSAGRYSLLAHRFDVGLGVDF